MVDAQSRMLSGHKCMFRGWAARKQRAAFLLDAVLWTLCSKWECLKMRDICQLGRRLYSFKCIGVGGRPIFIRSFSCSCTDRAASPAALPKALFPPTPFANAQLNPASPSPRRFTLAPAGTATLTLCPRGWRPGAAGALCCPCFSSCCGCSSHAPPITAAGRAGKRGWAEKARSEGRARGRLLLPRGGTSAPRWIALALAWVASAVENLINETSETWYSIRIAWRWQMLFWGYEKLLEADSTHFL